LLFRQKTCNISSSLGPLLDRLHIFIHTWSLCFKRGRLMPTGSVVTCIHMYKIAQTWCFRYPRSCMTKTIIRPEEETGDSKACITLFTLRPSSCQHGAGCPCPRPWVDPFVARDYDAVSLLSREVYMIYVRRAVDRDGSHRLGGVRGSLTCDKNVSPRSETNG